MKLDVIIIFSCFWVSIYNILIFLNIYKKVPLSLEKCGQNPSKCVCEKKDLWRLWIGFSRLAAEMFFQGRPATLDEHLFDRFMKIGHWEFLLLFWCFEKVSENCITILPPGPSRDTCHPTFNVIRIFFAVVWSLAWRERMQTKVRIHDWSRIQGEQEIQKFFLFFDAAVLFIAIRKSRSISL